MGESVKEIKITAPYSEKNNPIKVGFGVSGDEYDYKYTIPMGSYYLYFYLPVSGSIEFAADCTPVELYKCDAHRMTFTYKDDENKEITVRFNAFHMEIEKLFTIDSTNKQLVHFSFPECWHAEMAFKSSSLKITGSWEYRFFFTVKNSAGWLRKVSIVLASSAETPLGGYYTSQNSRKAFVPPIEVTAAEAK